MGDVNDPERTETWTDDFHAGWSVGFGHGVWEGLCRSLHAVQDKMRLVRPDETD